MHLHATYMYELLFIPVRTVISLMLHYKVTYRPTGPGALLL